MLFGKKADAADKDQRTQAEQALGTPAAAETASGVNGNKVSAEDARKRMNASKQMAAAFGEVVSLLMRSGSDKHHSLADLEWLVVPAIARGQYALAEAQSKETGATAPVGAVLWALVSQEVDKRLSDISAPVRLRPDEWRSGDIPWIVLATGDLKILGGLIQQLTHKAFNERAPRMRVRGADGKISVGQLEVRQKAATDA